MTYFKKKKFNLERRLCVHFVTYKLKFERNDNEYPKKLLVIPTLCR